ncbi:sulfatase-like hydrolase/transferase [Halovenus sp. WSH3]|uniref:Sulfatase-like hydrolase/transferase n=1 Tax=Halovenus carboxidivorans TaxID=2692199 RepID=A0A6B0TBJ2_9EURY|nr:sulfatase [Halovenus carboxidivorans]MXR53003.1 sulfatase-like hydrolase/transferase [Halovenus carboxidivorans]
MTARPNVLWISLESVRADHTSLHGYDRDTTPNLDRISRRPDATVLDPVVSGSMWTPASTASMLTGTHMSTHQLGADGKCERKLLPSVETLPERLSEQGYRTGLFTPTYYIGPETGLDRGFDHVDDLSIRQEDFFGYDAATRDRIVSALRCVRGRPTTDIATLKEEITRGKNYLLERRFDRWGHDGSTAPFFAYAHVPSPHHPYNPVTKFRDVFTDEIGMSAAEAAELSESVYTGTDGIRRRMARGLDLSDSEWEAITALYDAEIRYADSTAGELISTAASLSRRPLVIVVTGDHGDLFGELGLIGHNLVLHDGLTHVPGLVVGIDDVVDDSETVTQHIDLTRTVGAVTGVPTEEFEGRDIRSAQRPYAISQRGVAHLDEYTKHDERFDTSRFFEAPFTAVRTPDWKYLENDERAVLHDLPDERTDVLDGHPAVADELSGYIDAEGIDWGAEERAESVEFSEQARDQLRDLGYLA